MPLSPKAEAAPPFEAVFQELQQVVLRLEDGSLGLDEAVRRYERGTQLVRACQEAIDAAELRVTRLAAESASALSDLAADEQADLAAVVMYDAAGVRRAVSLQARVLNRMLTEMIEAQHFNENRLRELIGHTPFEVFVGALLGALSAISVR